MNFTSLTNTKEAKEVGTQVILSPTLGTIKVTPKACEILGVHNGDYVQIERGGDGNSYAVVGKSGFGNKLASSNKTGSGTLSLSSASAWKKMGGDTEFNISFDIAAEPAFVQEDAKFGGERKYFLLTEKSKEAKIVRKAKVSTDAVADVAESNTVSESNSEAVNDAPIAASTEVIEDENPFQIN